MALFDYKCDNGHVFERWFPTITDSDPELECIIEDCDLIAKKIPFGLPAYLQSHKKFTGTLRVKSFVDNSTGKTYRL